MFYMLPPGWQRWDWSGRNGRDFYVGFFTFSQLALKSPIFRKLCKIAQGIEDDQKEIQDKEKEKERAVEEKKNKKEEEKELELMRRKRLFGYSEPVYYSKKMTRSAFLWKNSNKKCLNDCPEPRNPFFPSLEFSDWWRKNFKWEEILWKLWR